VRVVAFATPRFEVENPCNGELITFTGESFYQVTSVGTQEGPNAGQPVHFEFPGVLRATGTGAKSGASYTMYDAYHEDFNAPQVGTWMWNWHAES
jgi:hypothetical protein